MPILRHGSKRLQIPFDHREIARLIYEGHDIGPDRDIPPEQSAYEQYMVNQELARLWGDQTAKPNFKTNAFFNSFPKTEGMTGPPSGIPPKNWSGRIFQEGETIIPPKVIHDYLDVQPTPRIDYKMRQIDQFQAPERQTTMLNSQEPVGGLLRYFYRNDETA